MAIVLGACSGEVLSLQVGECFDDPASFEEVVDVPRVDCAEPHDNEVVGLHQLGGSEYPGNDAVAGLADNACVSIFENYTGMSYLESSYEFGWLVPTDESWASGDREVICFAYDETLAKITGSIAR